MCMLLQYIFILIRSCLCVHSSNFVYIHNVHVFVCINIYILLYKPACVYYYNIYVALQNRNALKEKKYILDLPYEGTVTRILK